MHPEGPMASYRVEINLFCVQFNLNEGRRSHLGRQLSKNKNSALDLESARYNMQFFPKLFNCSFDLFWSVRSFATSYVVNANLFIRSKTVSI